jgi:iron complex outermembrane recepter protein
MRIIKSEVTIVAAIVNGVLATIAHAAQTTANDQPTQETAQLQEVEVTAQRTSENMQRVPVSISAITAQMAENMAIKQSQDITVAAPAVNYQPTPSGANITIRGIGGSGASADEAANAVYIDGVYQAATPGLMFTMNNIDRIEVAKGPQGTLFGRNSTGGVIQIVTRDPSQDLSADASVSYGNYESQEEQLYLTGGLTSSIAADVALIHQRQEDGWGNNVHDGAQAYFGESSAVRSKLRWNLGEATSLTVSAMFSDLRPPSGQGGSILPGELTKSGAGVRGTGYSGFYNIDYDGDYEERTLQRQFAATLRHEFSWARLVDTASYGRTNLTLLQEIRGAATAVPTTVETHLGGGTVLFRGFDRARAREL